MIDSSVQISVIIPTHGRPEQIGRCLDALVRQVYPRDAFEVLIVDDGSPQVYDAAIAPYFDRLCLRLIRQQHGGPAIARNRGAQLAKGALLAFTDDDCAPDPCWLTALARAAAEQPQHAIGGQVINRLERNCYSESSQLLVGYVYDYFNSGPTGATFFTSNNFAVPKAAFREVGGFDPRLPRAAAEDREFCDRWIFLGRRMEYAPKAVVMHAHPMRFTSYWRQHFNYGRGAHFFRDVRAKRGASQIRIEPSSFYINLLRYPLDRTTGSRKSACCALMFVAQVANAIGFFWERWNARPVRSDDEVERLNGAIA